MMAWMAVWRFTSCGPCGFGTTSSSLPWSWPYDEYGGVPHLSNNLLAPTGSRQLYTTLHVGLVELCQQLDPRLGLVDAGRSALYLDVSRGLCQHDGHVGAHALHALQVQEVGLELPLCLCAAVHHPLVLDAASRVARPQSLDEAPRLGLAHAGLELDRCSQWQALKPLPVAQLERDWRWPDASVLLALHTIVLCALDPNDADVQQRQQQGWLARPRADSDLR